MQEGQPNGAHLYQDMLDSPISHYYNKPQGEEVKTPGGIHYVDSMRVASSPHEPVDSGMGLNSYALQNKYGSGKNSQMAKTKFE